MRNLVSKTVFLVCIFWCHWPVNGMAFGDEETEWPALEERYREYFPIGSALKESVFENTRALALLHRHFNAVTVENAMKWSVIHPETGNYRFERADAIVRFAQQHGLKVIGHPLIWEYKTRTPDWVFQDADGEARSPGQVLESIREHITTVMTRYKGRIHSWDVVNEALADPRREIPETGEEYYPKTNRFQDVFGNDYIAKAFEFARQADPDAELYYNEYFFNSAIDGRKKVRDAVALIQWLQARNVPIDGIGIQGHWTFTHPRVEELEDAIEQFAALGLQVAISELDVRLWSGDEYAKSLSLPREAQAVMLLRKLRQQADRYEELFQVFLRHHERISRVTFWGISDRYSWRHHSSYEGFPLLFDEDGRPKPALERLLQIPLPAAP